MFVLLIDQFLLKAEVIVIGVFLSLNSDVRNCSGKGINETSFGLSNIVT